MTPTLLILEDCLHAITDLFGEEEKGISIGVNRKFSETTKTNFRKYAF